jgi:uncharacterized membrane protein
MLQYLYDETEAAAEEIVEAVAPELDETSKEDIAEAAADQAEAITDAVADASAAEGAEFTEEQYDAMLGTCAQVIYTEVMSQLACQQAQFAMEDLFTEEAVEDFYASLEEEADQETYGERINMIKRGWAPIGAHFDRNKTRYAAGGLGAVGAIGGAVVGRKIAAKKGMSTKKGAIIGALVGGAVGAAAGSATTKAGRAKWAGAYRTGKKFVLGK